MFEVQQLTQGPIPLHKIFYLKIAEHDEEYVCVTTAINGTFFLFSVMWNSKIPEQMVWRSKFWQAIWYEQPSFVKGSQKHLLGQSGCNWWPNLIECVYNKKDK